MREFPTILRELIDLVPVKPSAGSDVEHVIRVLKTYGLLKTDYRLRLDRPSQPRP
jgi:hypothetical protein